MRQLSLLEWCHKLRTRLSLIHARIGVRRTVTKTVALRKQRLHRLSWCKVNGYKEFERFGGGFQDRSRTHRRLALGGL
jgi:hypothetical protein